MSVLNTQAESSIDRMKGQTPVFATCNPSSTESQIAESLRFCTEGQFVIVWLDHFDRDEISLAISLFERHGWEVLQEAINAPDWLILFAQGQSVVENSDITGEDTDEFVEFFRSNGWSVEVMSSDPGHIVCKR